MNLVIDVGNTLLKLAVFNNEVPELKKKCLHEDFLDALTEVSEQFPDITHCMVSSVGRLTAQHLQELQQQFSVFELSHTTKLPFKNLYGTPETLGVDRIALASAAAKQYPVRNVLVIDAGSCITYDFLSEKNEYLGGAISPGIAMRYNAMHTFTEKLPLLDADTPKKLVGDTTATSMHSGVVFGVLFEINGFIDAYSEKYADLTVILTGGDAHFLRDSLKNDIFANSNFLLEGLNYILELNKD